MGALCDTLGVEHKVVKFEGSDFNRIFDGLASGAYDAVISGTTVTPEREAVARFTDPYLESGQSLVVNTTVPESPPSTISRGRSSASRWGTRRTRSRRSSKPRARSPRSSTTSCATLLNDALRTRQHDGTNERLQERWLQ